MSRPDLAVRGQLAHTMSDKATFANDGSRIVNQAANLTIHDGQHFHLHNTPEKSLDAASIALPFPRNPHFVERGTLLADIREKLLVPAARVALVGLGGIG